MKGMRRSCVIAGVGSYLPARRVANEELSRTLDTSDEWIYSHTGIRFRHIAAENEKASDLGLQASQAALRAAGLEAAALDMILAATSTGDYHGFPSTAAIIQGRLAASRAGAMDLAAACAGYVYGLAAAAAFIESGAASHVLVVGTEVMSRVLDWNDRATCVLFGDGAGAAVLSAAARASDSGARGILGSILRSDGSKAHVLTIEPAEGSPRPCVRMDGRAIYNFAVRVVAELVEEMTRIHGVGPRDLRAIVPHQANVRILTAAAKRLGLPADLFYVNMDRVANTSAASIPIAIAEMSAAGRLAPGDLLLTLGFGGGLAWGANLIRW